VELLKHKPWSKNNSLPILNNESTLEIFEEFRKSEKCPVSVNLALERVKNRQEMRKRGYVEPTTDELEMSQPISPDADDDTRDVVHATNYLIETTNVFAGMEQKGFDIGRNYDWSRRINIVSTHL
jgi:hypothetical protein